MDRPNRVELCRDLARPRAGVVSGRIFDVARGERAGTGGRQYRRECGRTGELRSG